MFDMKRKIYNKIVIGWNEATERYDDVLFEDSFEYEGPMALAANDCDCPETDCPPGMICDYDANCDNVTDFQYGKCVSDSNAWGACCWPNADCTTVATEYGDCTMLGGTYHGNGTSCTTIEECQTTGDYLGNECLDSLAVNSISDPNHQYTMCPDNDGDGLPDCCDYPGDSSDIPSGDLEVKLYAFSNSDETALINDRSYFSFSADGSSWSSNPASITTLGGGTIAWSTLYPNETRISYISQSDTVNDDSFKYRLEFIDDLGNSIITNSATVMIRAAAISGNDVYMNVLTGEGFPDIPYEFNPFYGTGELDIDYEVVSTISPSSISQDTPNPWVFGASNTDIAEILNAYINTSTINGHLVSVGLVDHSFYGVVPIQFTLAEESNYVQSRDGTPLSNFNINPKYTFWINIDENNLTIDSNLNIDHFDPSLLSGVTVSPVLENSSLPMNLFSDSATLTIPNTFAESPLGYKINTDITYSVTGPSGNLIVTNEPYINNGDNIFTTEENGAYTIELTFMDFYGNDGTGTQTFSAMLVFDFHSSVRDEDDDITVSPYRGYDFTMPTDFVHVGGVDNIDDGIDLPYCYNGSDDRELFVEAHGDIETDNRKYLGLYYWNEINNYDDWSNAIRTDPLIWSTSSDILDTFLDGDKYEDKTNWPTNPNDNSDYEMFTPDVDVRAQMAYDDGIDAPLFKYWDYKIDDQYDRYFASAAPANLNFYFYGRIGSNFFRYIDAGASTIPSPTCSGVVTADDCPDYQEYDTVWGNLEATGCTSNAPWYCEETGAQGDDICYNLYNSCEEVTSESICIEIGCNWGDGLEIPGTSDICLGRSTVLPFTNRPLLPKKGSTTLPDIGTQYHEVSQDDLYVAFVNWGDGSIEQETFDNPVRVGEPLNHAYARSGIYTIVGYMLFSDDELATIKDFKKFELNISVNKDLNFEDEFEVLGGDGYTQIPYNSTVPVVSGISTNSLYYKYMNSYSGCETSLDVLPPNILHGDISRIQYAMANIDSECMSPNLLNYTDIISDDTGDVYTGKYKNLGELGDFVGSVDLGRVSVFKRPMQMYEMLGFEGADISDDVLVRLYFVMTPHFANPINSIDYYIDNELVYQIEDVSGIQEYEAELIFRLSPDEDTKLLQIAPAVVGGQSWNDNTMKLLDKDGVEIVNPIYYQNDICQSVANEAVAGVYGLEEYWDVYQHDFTYCGIDDDNFIIGWHVDTNGLYGTSMALFSSGDSSFIDIPRTVLEQSIIDQDIVVMSSDAGNPGHEQYWQNIIPENYSLLDRDGVTLPTDNVLEIPINYFAGWNFVSIPCEIESYNWYDIFPEAVPGTLYAFDNTYVYNDQMEIGTGYWLNFESNGTTVISCISEISSMQVELNEGWNIIGSISSDIPVSSIIDPDGIIIPGTTYGFNNGYEYSDTIQPGNGYWVTTSSSGTITLQYDVQDSQIDQNSIEIDALADQYWLDGYYYPVLPKLKKFGKFSPVDYETGEGLQTSEGSTDPRVPFGSRGFEWDRIDDTAYVTLPNIDDESLLIDLDFSRITRESIQDNGGNNNIGCLIGDYKINIEKDIFNNIRFGSKTKPKIPRISKTKDKRAY